MHTAACIVLCSQGIKPKSRHSYHRISNIPERAAVPKEVILIDAMPVTAVGKIFKPTLRNDITTRLVNDILGKALAGDNFSVEVEASKKYGQIVKVSSPALNDDRLKELLGGFAFKSELA